MSRKDRVKKAIRFKSPDSIPILFFNKDKEQSDIILIDVVRHFAGDNRDTSEWGFKWNRNDDTMGQHGEILIRNQAELDGFKAPDPFDKGRFDSVRNTMKLYGDDRYYLAGLVLSGFTIMTLLRGFENTLSDLYIEPDISNRLADMVFGFEEDIIRQLKGYGFDGVAFYDDWGTQNNLIISPVKWREFFKPRYKKQFDLAHSYGLDVYFHSCGYIYDIIPDLIEIGVDMLNLSQPNIFSLEELGNDFRGKVCFVCPISYQTTSLFGTGEEIYNEARRLYSCLGSPKGGFIGYVEEYSSIGMSDENYNNCINAFRSLK